MLYNKIFEVQFKLKHI